MVLTDPTRFMPIHLVINSKRPQGSISESSMVFPQQPKKRNNCLNKRSTLQQKKRVNDKKEWDGNLRKCFKLEERQQEHLPSFSFKGSSWIITPECVLRGQKEREREREKP